MKKKCLQWSHLLEWLAGGRHALVLQAPGGGGTPWNFWWGCAARISKSRPNFRPKMPFPTPVFRPGFKNPYPFSDLALYVIKHNRSNLARMIYFIYFCFYFTSYSPWLLGRKISSWAFVNVPPIIIPNFRPKCLKSIPVFRPKRLKNHTLWGGTYLYTLYRGVPPRDRRLKTWCD